MKFLNKKTLLITGGTGSFGNAAVKYLLKNADLKKIIIFSRDENKQFEMQNKFKHKSLRFFLGDVRDEERLLLALNDVDFVIHAAAQKHVPAAEYNPFECIKTNIFGSNALISAAIKKKISKVIAISTDKACNPINLYGATKLCAEKLFINANVYSANNAPIFSVARYGNVIASRGSVIPFFKNKIKAKEELPLTDKNMSRFFITLEDAVKFVFNCLEVSKGQEIFIPKMNSIYIIDLIKILSKEAKVKITKIRPGEKIHEILCSEGEIRNVYANKGYYVIYPENFQSLKKKGKPVARDFNYTSNSKNFLDNKKIEKLLKTIKF